jgi:hypothetical protein
MSMRRSIRLLLAAAVLAAGVASAQSSADRAKAFAKLPDWRGFWIAKSRDNLGVSGQAPGLKNDSALMRNPPPYTTEWAAQVAERRKNASTATKECGFPFPFVMENPWVFQFLLTPEETAMIWGGREVRHVYTDGRSHPKTEDLWATPWGDSVGHWEGDTLVVDTIAVQSTRFPPSLSEQAHFTERLRMTGPDTFEDQLTIEDPVALTEPWKITIPYERVKELDRMVHGLCDENDRNPVVDGKIVVAPAEQ